MDTITITDLEVHTHIGITDEERSAEQTLKISVHINTDLSTVGESDDIRDTIDYEVVAKAIRDLAATPRNTVERFAEDCTKLILKRFGGQSVTVTIKKYILPDTDHVGVTITRSA